MARKGSIPPKSEGASASMSPPSGLGGPITEVSSVEGWLSWKKVNGTGLLGAEGAVMGEG